MGLSIGIGLYSIMVTNEVYRMLFSLFQWWTKIMKDQQLQLQINFMCGLVMANPKKGELMNVIQTQVQPQ
jgi:hypothetical protein